MSDRAGLEWLGRILGAPALPPRTTGDPRYTADEVKAAFRKLARECHPDTSRLPKEEAEHRFHAINEAYGYIKQTKGW